MRRRRRWRWRLRLWKWTKNSNFHGSCSDLTHWGRVTHICVGKLTIIASDNGLSPGRRKAIIWTNARILLIGPLGTNFSENLIEILTFSFTKRRLKVPSAKWRPFCLGLNVSWTPTSLIWSNVRSDDFSLRIALMSSVNKCCKQQESHVHHVYDSNHLGQQRRP